MPIRAVVDRDNQLVYSRCEGVITVHDFERHHATTGMDATLHGYDEIFDLTGASDWNIFNLDFIKIARSANSLPAIDPHAHLAVVCNSQKTNSIVRLYAYIKKLIRAPSRAIYVFKTVKEAEQWIAYVRREQAAVTSDE